jgi:acetyl-CoA carboxylase biotin carboxyl carrier protein
MKRENNGKGFDPDIAAEVSALYELMKSEKLEELEIKEENFYISIKRKGKPPAHTNLHLLQSLQAAGAVQAREKAEAEADVPAGPSIKSPITGVFYRAPSPTSAPFVQEGDVVDQGKTLCVVEAMKVMNEIKAESKIRIAKILVENGKQVTSQQDIFLIEKV